MNSPASSAENLHGSAPDTHNTALLLIDVINALDFPEADELLPHALAAARRIAALRERARKAGIPCVYVNDNFGRWRSDFREVVKACSAQGVRGRPLVDLLRPAEDDYFVLKPKHSGFFSSSLELLLEKLGSRELVLAGFAGNICVLFTANDAYMRDFKLYVPQDCCASNSPHDNEHALRQMRLLLKARTEPSELLRFGAEGVSI